MKKIISFWLLISIFSLTGSRLYAARSCVAALLDSYSMTSYTVLFAGLDDVAGNTDALILFNYDLESNEAAFVHIPRDSYIDYGSGEGKINQIVPESISAGIEVYEAINILSEKVSEVFGVKIDGFAAYTPSSVAKIVDAVGGIDIDIPFDISITLTDGSIRTFKKGNNHLSGEESVAFIRNRKDYQLGDLARINAQKIFLSSFIQKLKESIGVEVGLKLLLAGKKGVVTNIKFSNILTLALKNRSRIISSSVLFANAPGEALVDKGGVSYYAVNKKAAANLITDLHFIKISDFDIGENLCKSADPDFEKIYFSTDIDYRIYTDDDLRNLGYYIK